MLPGQGRVGGVGQRSLSIQDAGAYSAFSETGVFLHNIISRLAMGQAVEDMLNGQARAANDGFAGHFAGVHFDVGQEFVVTHEMSLG